MKQLVVSAALLALCYGNAIPIVTSESTSDLGQNHYQMPDAESSPNLSNQYKPLDADFMATRNDSDNEYWLYTRQNPSSPQILTINDVDSLFNSNYRADRPLIAIVHGWNNNGNSLYNPTLTAAFLEVQDANVIVVDWRHLSSTPFENAAAGVYGVGQYLGRFLLWVISSRGGNWDNVHLVGFSMGAHVVASSARVEGVRVQRITALDPARDTWENNPNALNSGDAQYVEAIHTDGGGFGIFSRSGHADFYPNGGRDPQPGCNGSICSHIRAWDYFASSIGTDHLVGRECTDMNQAANVECSGRPFNMGNADINKQGSGIYGLRTGSLWPY